MYKTKILIISNRKELSIKYKKLIDNLNQEALYTNDLSYALSFIQQQQSEFIIISDTIKEDLASFIEKIRALTYNFRPIIIAISKSNDENDKIKVLKSGADDCWGEEISKMEFQTRFMAHLRRYIESFLNPITKFFDKTITQKVLRQSILDDEKYSYLLIKIQGAKNYLAHHGEIAFDKMVKTLGAIVSSITSNDDYIGHIFDDELLLITKPYLSERIASFLTFAFDNVVNKFYSENEYSDNFTMLSDELNSELKSSLVHINVAAENIKDYRQILRALDELVSMLEDKEVSNYIIDRARLNGVVQKCNKNRVLIYEPDEALSYLLQNVCEIENIEVKLVFSDSDFKLQYKAFRPNVVILDWGLKEKTTALKLARTISKDDIKLIFSSSYLNKKEILKSGATLYMPKPYEIEDMISAIKKFLL